MKVAGKVVLVTGGADGIGEGLVLRFLENEAKFVAIIDYNLEKGQKVSTELSKKFGADRVKFIHCDVTNQDLLKRSFQEAYDVHNTLDIVVNNAGIISKDHRKNIAVNLVAVLDCIFIAQDLMTKEKRTEKGLIINTASIGGFSAYHSCSPSYIASKHGVVGITRSLVNGTDMLHDDLRVVSICPASVNTKILTNHNFNEKDVIDIDDPKDVMSISTAVDAFFQGIEDDSLNGAMIIVTANKPNTVVY